MRDGNDLRDALFLLALLGVAIIFIIAGVGGR